MKYLFGPVNSRRLGLSQGIDVLPAKICNFNCIYCEVGATTRHTCDRQEYSPTKEILDEIDTLLAGEHPPIDVFTITASGEPTLHSGLGSIINHIKHTTNKPVVILTNGSLLHIAEIRSELMAADIVIPSLDSAREESFRKINRPAKCVQLADIISGLCSFSREFPGKIWLEILLVKGINDSDADIAALVETTRKIRPDRIQLNTVVRPPLESYAAPMTEHELKKIARQFAGQIEIIADFAKRKRHHLRSAAEPEILDMLKRRPCTAPDICEALNLDLDQVEILLNKLLRNTTLTSITHAGKIYYQTHSENTVT